MTTLTSLNTVFTLGESSSFGGLALVPIFPSHEPQLEYVGLDEASAAGLAVTEISDAGAVSTLFVSNPLDFNVLLYEGSTQSPSRQGLGAHAQGRGRGR